MNNFFKIILLFIVGISIVSCNGSDNDTEPLRDYDAQYATDLANIEAFMHNHYMTVVNNPGGTDDQDVTFTLIPAGGTQTSIWDQTAYPIQTRLVTLRQSDDVERTYKVYYIKLRDGSGPNSKSPCNMDRVLAAYKGEYIYDSVETVGTVETHTIISEEFETSANPQSYINLSSTIRGWNEIFPQFKTGSYISNPDGTVSYEDFGAGIMFIPSGLGYFASAQSGIPAYSPLVFNIKLYELQRVDHDGDGIDTYLEDMGSPGHPGVPDGYVYTLEEGVVNPDDTDGDEIPDFLDADDDGDHFTTKSETKYIHPSDLSQTIRYYPFSGAALDDPTTPYVDETKGIPDCSNDFTSPTRLRKYLDPACH
jgi:hypothetical protein